MAILFGTHFKLLGRGKCMEEDRARVWSAQDHLLLQNQQSRNPSGKVQYAFIFLQLQSGWMLANIDRGTLL